MSETAIAAYLMSLSEKYGRFAENPDYEDQPTTRGIFRTVSVLLAEEARHVGADRESADRVPVSDSGGTPEQEAALNGSPRRIAPGATRPASLSPADQVGG